MPASERRPPRRRVPNELFGGRLRDAYLLDLEVADIREPAPHVRSMTMASSDLIDFEFAPGQDLMLAIPGVDRPVRRRYTIRRANPDAGTADIEFELHAGGGVAARWAAAAEIGSRLEAIGPRGTITLEREATSYLFVVDDSAMPAAFVMLEALPMEGQATALLITPHGPQSRPATDIGPGVRCLWVELGQLHDVIGEVQLDAGTAAYVLGERQMVRRAVNFVAEAGADPDHVASKAYWRDDKPNAEHGEPPRD